MMNLRTTILVAAAVLTLPLVGCNATQEQRAGTGALIGAGAGAVAGQAIGRDTRSTVIGAAGGAIAGAVIGSATTPPGSTVNCRFRRSDGSIFIAPCPR